MIGRLMPVRILTMGMVFLLLARWLVLVQDSTVLHPPTTRDVDKTEDPLRSAVAVSYVTHDPIMISSNEEFALAGFSGDGSSTNPYIIEGFNITSTGTSIRVADTDAYFIIRDCFLAGGLDGDGVALDNVTHGKIHDNHICRRRYGIVLTSSTKDLLVDNSVDHSSVGIQFWGSSNCTLVSNTVCNSSRQGIYFYGSSENIIMNCQVANNSQEGILLWESSRNIVVSNEASENYGGGVYLDLSDDNNLTENIISRNSEHGVDLRGSHRNEIVNNTIARNSESGVYVGTAGGNNLENNTISVNSAYGVYLSYSPKCTLSSNIFLNNGVCFQEGTVFHWQQNIPTDNLVNGKPLGYFWNQTGQIVEGSQYGQVILANCSEMTVRDGVFGNVSPGILIGYSSSCTAVNNTVSDGSTNGIYLCCSVESGILNNTVLNNSAYGVCLAYSQNCTVSSNVLLNNGLFIAGRSVAYWQQNITTDNLVNGKPLGYFWNQAGQTIEGSQYGQVILANCSEMTVREGVFGNVSPGISVGSSSDCSFINNTVRFGSVLGMYLIRSEGVELIQNSLSDNSKGVLMYECRSSAIVQNAVLRNSGDGVFLDSCRNITLRHNDISGNLGDGIHLFSVNDTVIYNVVRENAGDGIYVAEVGSTIAHNSIAANGHNGVHVTSGWENFLSNNSIVSNSEDGIALDGGRDNVVRHNTIKESGGYGVSCGRYTHDNHIHSNMLAYNTVNAYDEGTNNHWNTTGRGNFWSDYNGTGVYPIPGTAGAIDHHPAVYESVPPTVSHPADIVYEEGTTGHTLQWSASEDHPSSYAVYRNGTQVAAASWNGSPISIGVDGLSAGVYNYTLVVSDIFGNQATDTVFVIVTAQTDTTTTQPPDGLLTNLFVLFLGVIAAEAVVASIILLRYRRGAPPGTG